MLRPTFLFGHVATHEATRFGGLLRGACLVIDRLVALVCVAACGPAGAQALVVSQYAVLVQSRCNDTVTASLQLQVAIWPFTAVPSLAGLDTARKAWLLAPESDGQTKVVCRYGDPIEGGKGPQGCINAWPMDEVHVAGGVGVDLISDCQVAVIKKGSSALNERDSEGNIATG